MVQTPNQNNAKRKKVLANLPLLASLSVLLIMAFLVAIFFRVGSPQDEEAKPIPLKIQHQINAHIFKSEVAKKEGRLQEAIEELEKAIGMMEAEKSDDWMTITTRLVMLSDMYRESGQLDKGIIPLQKARANVEKYHLEEDHITCQILLDEGVFCFVDKKYADAEEQFQQALSCSQALTGSLSFETSQCLIWLANAYLSPAFNSPKRALQYLRMVEEVCSTATPERPLQMMFCQQVQGQAFLQMKKYAEAEEKFLSAKEIAERLFAPTNNQRQHLDRLLEQLKAERSAAGL